MTMIKNIEKLDLGHSITVYDVAEKLNNVIDGLNESTSVEETENTVRKYSVILQSHVDNKEDERLEFAITTNIKYTELSDVEHLLYKFCDAQGWVDVKTEDKVYDQGTSPWITTFRSYKNETGREKYRIYVYEKNTDRLIGSVSFDHDGAAKLWAWNVNGGEDPTKNMRWEPFKEKEK